MIICIIYYSASYYSLIKCLVTNHNILRLKAMSSNVVYFSINSPKTKISNLLMLKEEKDVNSLMQILWKLEL